MALQVNNQLRLYETRTFLKGSSSAVERFYVTSGSRMLVTLKVLSADLGATVTLTVGNTFDVDTGYDTLDTFPVTGVGLVKRIYSDFHNQFELSVNVSGGNADYRVAVSLFDNSGTTRIENAQLAVDLSDIADTLGHFDSVRIGDGTGPYLDINPDGTINIGDPVDESPLSLYDESPAVPTGTAAPILTYVVPNDKVAFLYRAEASGENVARYQVLVNDEVIATRRTHHGSGLTTEFTFLTFNKKTIVLQPGDVIKLVALHNRPTAGDFEARIQLTLKDAP